MATQPLQNAEGRDPLPRHTTPTWEMELLLSGATVFGLMQLPALLDSGLNTLLPRFDRDTGALLLPPFLYVKSAVQVLVLTFLLHLALRGYWIALVGLSSVHPRGVDWDGLRWGRLYTAVLRRRTGAWPALIERADNRASEVFGFGIGFALALLAPLLLVGSTSLLAYAAHLALGRQVPWRSLWYAFLAALALPYLAGVLLDRAFGAKLDAQSRRARALSWLLEFYVRIGFRTVANYPVTLFLSRYGRRRGTVVLVLLLGAMVGSTLFGQLWTRLGGGVGQYGALAAADIGRSRTLLTEHYADRRSTQPSLSPLPFIESAVASGDYLRLFLPFRPTRDLPALRERCPGVLEDAGEASLRAEDAAIAATLDCLGALYPLALDGRPLGDPRFDVTDDPVTGLRGVQAMIRIDDLPRGRHELSIGRPPDPMHTPGDPRETRFVIPFWR